MPPAASEATQSQQQEPSSEIADAEPETSSVQASVSRGGDASAVEQVFQKPDQAKKQAAKVKVSLTKDDKTGRAAVTADGGETWTLLADGAGPGYGSSVRFRPGSGGQQLALVGSPGGIDVSDDGGATWRHVSDSAFYAARFSPSGETLWLCGHERVGRISAHALGW